MRGVTQQTSATSNRDSLEDRETHPGILRIMTCGSVDDGKSTLIGRLLLEAESICEDHLASLREDSRRHGTTAADLDPALLLDGLEDERRQGITIDVAYRYFRTPRRKFIIADSPGHEQYTRNMATAASSSQLAILLVDARKGLLVQTRRHAMIATLLGIEHLVVAINKMDLVGYDQSIFAGIRYDFEAFAQSLRFSRVDFVPVSGLRGDNIKFASREMPWYAGKPLLRLLEAAPSAIKDPSGDLRFPVQRVNRPNSEFRGYSGTLLSGSLAIGDDIVVMPSKKRSRVHSIVTFDGDRDRAGPADAITVTLEDELDISRGDMIVHAGRLPRISQQLEADLVWMSDHALIPGKPYWFKQTTRQTQAQIESVVCRWDVNSLGATAAATLRVNDIGRCRLSLHDEVVHDTYRENRKTGAFVLVDRITHETVAAGMIADSEGPWLGTNLTHAATASPTAQNAGSRIPSTARRSRWGHDPLTILITGLSGSGKTTVAYGLEEALFAAGLSVVVLDGQNLRRGISRDLGYSSDERAENLRRAAEIARLVNDAGLICIGAFVAPGATVRAAAKQTIGDNRVFHFHLSAPVEICRERDPTGMYQRADRGDFVQFPGVTSAYEIPEDADLVIPSHEWPIEQCVAAAAEAALNRLHSIR